VLTTGYSETYTVNKVSYSACALTQQAEPLDDVFAVIKKLSFIMDL
jgi:hypothetical protein